MYSQGSEPNTHFHYMQVSGWLLATGETVVVCVVAMGGGRFIQTANSCWRESGASGLEFWRCNL